MNSRGAIVKKYKRLLRISAEPSDADHQASLLINFNGNESSSDVWQSVIVANSFDGTGIKSTGATVGSGIIDRTVYDQNRCSGVKIEWHPAFPAGSLQGSYIPMTVTWDNDGIEGDVVNTTVENMMEQVEGTKVFNAYQRWSLYIKAPKQLVNNNTPSANPPFAAASPTGYKPNVNIAGQWKGCQDALVASANGELMGSGMLMPRNRAFHIACVTQGNSAQGYFVITTYYTYKDSV